MLKNGEGTLDFKGSQVTVGSAAGDWNGLAWTASGAVTAGDVRAPAVNMAVKLPGAALTLGPEMDGTASMDLLASGTPAGLALSGSAELQTLKVNRSGSMESLVAPGGTGLEGTLPALTLAGPPAWKLDIRVAGNAVAELANTSGTVSPALEISGSIGRPAISGSIAVKGFTVAEGPDHASITGGTFFLNAPNPAATPLVLHATGIAGGDAFDGYIYGTVAEKHFTWGPEVTTALAGESEPAPMPAGAAEPLPLDAGITAQPTQNGLLPAPALQ
jgi:hypothetical protein